MSQPTKLQWRREDVMQLIELYKENNCLWQVKSEKYKDRNARDIALLKIVEHLKDNLPQVTVFDVKTKLHTLRSQFCRELRLIREFKKSGSEGTEKKSKTKLWCFNDMMFLHDGEETLESVSTLGVQPDEIPVDDDDDDDDGDDDDDDLPPQNPTTTTEPSSSHTTTPAPTLSPPLPMISHSRSPSPTPSTSDKPAKRKRKVDKTDELIAMAVSRLSESVKEPDEFKAFGIVVGSQLKTMDKYQAIVARKLINDILFTGSLNKLEATSQIVSACSNINVPVTQLNHIKVVPRSGCRK
ncbi:putative Alcohol dehydrogenase transcription factor Myb/SANT-like-containing protein 23, partial [Homarus americanus]